MPLKTRKPSEIPMLPMIGIYGPSGDGKTRLLKTLKGRGLIVDTPELEGGTFVIGPEEDGRIDIHTLESFDGMDAVYEAMRDEGGFNWIAFDSATGLMKLAMKQICKNPAKPTLPEWGEIGDALSQEVLRFKMLNLWIIWLAQERSYGGREDNPDEPFRIGPNLTPSSLRTFNPSLLMLARLFRAEDNSGRKRRMLRVGWDPVYMTKVRALPGKELPDVIRDPNLNDIFMYLFKDGKRPRAADFD